MLRTLHAIILLNLAISFVLGKKDRASRDTINFEETFSPTPDNLKRKLKKSVSSFLWGVATAAYQIEGSTNSSGRGASIWDTFSHNPGKIANGDTGDVADGSYDRVKEDVALIKAMGLNAYRFSISWSRILPRGSLADGGANYEAIQHYNFLIDELIDAGIDPMVTLYHWDLPQALEDKYAGWISPLIEDDFRDYAEVCFTNFGDRVKKWITLNEPWTYSLMGYGTGSFAPGRCSDRSRCAKGNSSTEPYIVAHNSLNAHAAAVELYRTKYQKRQGGVIGITLNHDWAEPRRADSEADKAAAQRRNEFAMAWFLDPLTFGFYPQSMRRLVGERLPHFSEGKRRRLTGSYDFIGLNHYSSKYYSEPLQDGSGGLGMKGQEGDWGRDQHNVESKYSEFGLLIGQQGASPWLNKVPWGLYKVLKWNTKRYTVAGKPPPVLYVTENGCDVPGESTLPLPLALQDSFRIDYHRDYLAAMAEALDEGVDVRGYFAWSLLDNFEWADGYSFRFGLHYVDYSDQNLPRYPKSSAKWYASYVANHSQSFDTGRGVGSGVGKAAATAAAVASSPLSFLVNALQFSSDVVFTSNL